ncbi:MAG: hypothetical protein ACKEQI_00795 [Candidatus Hodgkinia cicadicola]
MGALNNLEKIKEKIQKYKLMKYIFKCKANWFRGSDDHSFRNASFGGIPRLASITRLKKRCFVTGRSRGFYNAFGVSRIILRQMASAGLMPGVSKSSW